ncbi:hypothetical protein [Neisseria sp. P0019.S003]|uniref:hypothetical protein n=1 Tax=Neisseria sp. P0019.S003 TaxID=3436799 RepID=UPI003F7D54A7
MKKSLIALALSVLKPQLPEFEIKPASIGYLKQHPSTVGRDKTGKTSGELVICNW